MSGYLTAAGHDLRLTRRPRTGGYWVRCAATGRTLGEVAQDRSKWIWATTRIAFQGDGRPDSASDGWGDRVPAHLDGLGLATTRAKACAALVAHLDARKAPALGHGPHPDVRQGVHL
jgi:hypothetical protein